MILNENQWTILKSALDSSEPLNTNQIVTASGLDMPQVSATVQMAADEGWATIDENQRDELVPADRAKELLHRVGLNDHLDHRPAQLSGGEQQRVAVVRALINQPKLILADEPTGSLDSASSENLSDLLVQLNREENVTLVVVTHSLDLAGKMSKTYLLRDGKLKQNSILQS